MTNQPTPPAEGALPSPIEPLREAVDHVVDELPGQGGGREIQGPENYYLLDADLRDLIHQSMQSLGLPLETPPATMYDYDPTFLYHFYRIPLADGYLALVYLRNRITEAYEPNNNLAQLFDWLTQANPDLEVKAICFFTDGSSVDLPYKSMADTWVRRGIVRFVEFVDQRFTRNLQRMQNLDQRKVALGRIFRRDELAPAEDPGPGGHDEPPGRTVASLYADAARKNDLVSVLAAYFSASMPAISVRERASNLIDGTSWPELWKDDRKAALMDNAQTDARNLVEYAIEQAYIPDTQPPLCVLGNLLVRIKPSLGPESLKVVEDLLADFNL